MELLSMIAAGLIVAFLYGSIIGCVCYLFIKCM